MADVRIDFGFDDLDKADRVLKELQKAAKNLRDAMKKTGTVLESDLQKAKQFATTTKNIANEKKKLTAVEKEQLRIETALERTEAKIQLATSKEAKLLQKKQQQLRAINTQLRTGGKNTNAWSKALGSFQFKFNALGNIAANVTSAISRSLVRALRDAVKVVVEFDQAMADVKAITGSTGKEFDKLRDSAKALGGTTKFTASQVALLQKEYAKLGFTTDEILKAQAATLDLAAATNTDLARAAEVAGITIRQFRLNASDTQRVVDVMARSFTSSALDMEKFAEAMKFVGPAAKASGISLERTTAIIGQLADAGISGSMAGTSLRQIMLALSDESGTFSEKIERAAESGLTLAGAADEVQKRAATALLVMANGVSTIDAFTEALEGAGGAAQEMADVQLDTLIGKATILRSAWEGLILEFTTTEDDAHAAKTAFNALTIAMNAATTAMREEIPILAALSLEAAVAKSTMEALDEVAKDNAISFDEWGTAIKGVGKSLKQLGKDIWAQLFPKESGDDAGKTIENIDKLVANLKDETKFEEGDDDWVFADQIFWDKINNLADENLKERLRIMQESRDRELEIEADARKKQEDADKKAADTRAEVWSDSFNHIGNSVNAFSDLFRSAKEKELSAAGDNAKAREEIERKFARKEQALAIASATINGAEAITQIWSKWAANPVIAGIFTALAAGTTAAQIAIIKNQKFAEGGWVGGEPHSRGGTNIEAERGEFVVKARSASKYKDLIHAINEDDQVRIMDAMSRDRKITVNGSGDPYTRKMYELMSTRHSYGEDREFYYKQVGNTMFKTRKN